MRGGGVDKSFAYASLGGGRPPLAFEAWEWDWASGLSLVTGAGCKEWREDGKQKTKSGDLA